MPIGYLLTNDVAAYALDNVQPELLAGPCANNCGGRYSLNAAYQVKIGDQNTCRCGKAIGNSLRTFDSGGAPMFAMVAGKCSDALATRELKGL